MNEKAIRKRSIAQAMKNARSYMGLTQAQVAEKLGITYQAVSNYERGINSIESDVLAKMCKIYYIDVSFVLSEDIYICPDCGLPYNPNDKLSENEHETFCKASHYYGFCYPWGSMSLRKNEIYDILYSENHSFEEKFNAATELLKVYFSRSVGQRGYTLDHPTFEKYAAMLLNQNQFKERFGDDIYNRLLEKYGKLPGIPEGETTYQIRAFLENSKKSTKINKSYSKRNAVPSGDKKSAPPYSEEAMRLAKDYDVLDSHGKRVVRLVADEEKARCTAQARTEQQAGQDEPDNVVYIFPGYSVPMSAGTGQPAGDEYPETYRLIKEPPRRASFIAPVTGDSMEPTYHDGDKLFIRSCEEIEVGQIGVFLMDGQQWVKELGDGELISHNPEYGPIPMRDDIRCQGLVLGVCNESYFE